MRRSYIRDVATELFGEGASRAITSLDIIGDIAIVKLPDEFLEKKYEFGERLLEKMPYIKVVLRQASPVKGEYRLRRLEYLAGERRKWTIHKEYGIKVKVDVEKVYFTPRLSTERWRVATLVKEGEVVVNMFAGVGPYSILIAKYSRPAHVHSIDINLTAIHYHIENVRLNGVEDKVTIYSGDAAKVIEEYLICSADRVLMPLPEKALSYLKYALKALNRRGWIHVYLHVPYKRDWREALVKGADAVKIAIPPGFELIEVRPNKVREVATRTLQVCVDAYVARK